MKLNLTQLLVMAIAAVLILAVLGIWNPFGQQGGGGGGIFPTPVPTTIPSDLVNVNKPLKIVGVDELAGGALDGTTSAVTVYDSDGKTVLETGSFSSGSVTTAASYPSGKTLWIKYYYDTTIDSYMWWQVTVPKMSNSDAQSLTSNQITLKTREAGAYTDALRTSSGLSFTDADYLNTTGSTNDTLTFQYTFYTTSDNTGYPTFRDPIYNLDMKIQVWATLSGTGYSSISLTGFDGGFEKGSTMYYYKTVSPNDVSKYKVGNDYVYQGIGTVSFTCNAAGFSNSTTSVPTMYLYLKIYSNDGYLQQYGDYGPYDFTGASAYIYFADI
jgi:hypothetical protein